MPITEQEQKATWYLPIHCSIEILQSQGEAACRKCMTSMGHIDMDHVVKQQTDTSNPNLKPNKSFQRKVEHPKLKICIYLYIIQPMRLNQQVDAINLIKRIILSPHMLLIFTSLFYFTLKMPRKQQVARRTTNLRIQMHVLSFKWIKLLIRGHVGT